MSRDRLRVQRIHSGGPWETEVGYSRAIRIGERVLVAGTTAARGDGHEIPSGAGDQARIALETIGLSLASAGATLGDVVRTRIFVVDLPRHGAAVLAAHHAVLARTRPVISTLGIAALVDPRLLVEIEVEAVVGSGDVYEG